MPGRGRALGGLAECIAEMTPSLMACTMQVRVMIERLRLHYCFRSAGARDLSPEM